MSEVIDLLKDLIAIDSTNSGLVPDGVGETEIARFIENWLEDRGFNPIWLENVAGRPSIVCVHKGRGGGKALMLNGHIDAVGTSGYAGDPFDSFIKDGRMYGRGSSDMKSGVAAMMTAFTRSAKANLSGDIILACVADEEHASIGTENILSAGYTANAAIVCEPVGYEIVTAHKGFIWFDVHFEGIAAHGSRPDKGIDAIVKAGKFLSAMEEYAEILKSKPPHPRLGLPSVHASLIEGGNELSTYPSHCQISLERRTIPGETISQVKAEIETILNKIANSDPDFKAVLKMGLERAPHECNPDANIISVLEKAGRNVIGASPNIGKMNGWTDCALLAASGIDSVLIGPDGSGGHSKEESVSLSSVEQLAEILFETAINYCGSHNNGEKS